MSFTENSRPTAVRQIVILFILFVIWDMTTRFSLVSPLLLPSPGALFSAVIRGLATGELLRYTGWSLLVVFIGLAAGLTAAYFMAATGLYSLWAASLWQILSLISHPLPGLALLPLLIIWTGLGSHIIFLIVFHSVVWPLFINLKSGFDHVPPLWIEVARNNELSRRQIIIKIFLPATLPVLLSGLRIAWARAWRAAVAAEMIFGAMGSSAGLGWYIFNARIFMDTTGLYAGLICLIITGIIMEELIFRKLEQYYRKRYAYA